MREHELELIAALVEGRLDDESEARALIDSSPEMREEYEAQKQGYQALQEAGTVSMRDSERAALHRDIWTELRSGSAVPPPKTPWYYRWVTVAAGALIVVGLVAVLGQGGDDAGEEAVNLAADMGETTTTASASDGGADTGAAAVSDGDDAARSGSPTEEAEAEGESTASPEEADFLAVQARHLREGELTGSQLETFDAADQTDEHTDCLARIGLGGHLVVATTSSLHGETLLVTVPDESALSEATVGFVDPDVCELVYLDE